MNDEGGVNMANDYSSLGFGFTCPEDLLCFTNAHSEAVEFKTTKQGPYGYLQIGPKIELWYYGDESYLKVTLTDKRQFTDNYI